MARFRKIDPRIWTDEQFRGFSHVEKLAWFYLLTGSDVNSVGLYRLSPERLAAEVAIPQKRALTIVISFHEKKRIQYDGKTSLVWIPKWLNYNSPSGDNQAKNYVTTAEEHLPHPFARAFIMLLSVRWPNLFGTSEELSPNQATVIRVGWRALFVIRHLGMPEKSSSLQSNRPAVRIKPSQWPRVGIVVNARPRPQQKDWDFPSLRVVTFLEAKRWSVFYSTVKCATGFPRFTTGFPPFSKELRSSNIS